MLKVLVADDDAYMRIFLKESINRARDCVLVGEAENGMQLVKMAKELTPDVIFVDVEMPAVDGIKGAKAILKQNQGTFIVFATGYSDYIDEALKMDAFDYLLKPFSLERVHETLEKIKTTKAQSAEHTARGKALGTANEEQKLLINTGEKSQVVDSKEIILVARKERKTIIHTATGLISTNEPLKSLLERLPRPIFLHSHKGYIINTAKVLEILPWGARVRLVKLAGTKEDAFITTKKLTELKRKYL